MYIMRKKRCWKGIIVILVLILADKISLIQWELWDFLSRTYSLDTFQDFLSKFGIKLHPHLVEISIFSSKHVIVRCTKIIKDRYKASMYINFIYVLIYWRFTQVLKNFGRSDDDIIQRKNAYFHQISTVQSCVLTHVTNQKVDLLSKGHST